MKQYQQHVTAYHIFTSRLVARLHETDIQLHCSYVAAWITKLTAEYSTEKNETTQ